MLLLPGVSLEKPSVCGGFMARLLEADILKIIGTDFSTCTSGETDGRVYFSSAIDGFKRPNEYNAAMEHAIVQLDQAGYFARRMERSLRSNGIVQALRENWFVFLWRTYTGTFHIELRRSNAMGGYDASERIHSDVAKLSEARALATNLIDTQRANYLIDYSLR